MFTRLQVRGQQARRSKGKGSPSVEKHAGKGGKPGANEVKMRQWAAANPNSGEARIQELYRRWRDARAKAQQVRP